MLDIFVGQRILTNMRIQANTQLYGCTGVRHRRDMRSSPQSAILRCICASQPTWPKVKRVNRRERSVIGGQQWLWLYAQIARSIELTPLYMT
jgi:hypothetical protein